MLRTSLQILFLFALIVIGGLPLGAQPIVLPGVDVFQTLGGNGTQIDFSADPIPADAFCPGSAPFTGIVELQGVPLATSPAGAAGNSDALVERLDVADLSTGSALVPVVVRALQLRGTSLLTVFCPGVGFTEWGVRTCLCKDQPITQIKISLDDPACGCGRFSGELALNVCLTFVEVATGRVVGPLPRPVQLAIGGAPWCLKAPLGTLALGPFKVDTNCDGRPDLAVGGTSNFHPGFDCASLGSGLSCLDLFGHLTTCHENFGNPGAHPHCINPVCDRQK